MALALTFAAYIACTSAGYTWDDNALILRNQALTEPTVRRLLGSDLWCCCGRSMSGYWRPLTTLSFYLDVRLFGFRAAWGHLHSLAWHLLCVALVGKLVAHRHGEARGAVASLIFGLHPVLSEAVVWIAARNDLMAAAFSVASVAAVDRRRVVPAGGLAFAAALSKESSLLLPALAALWVGAHEGLAGVKARRGPLLGTGAGLCLALGLRLLAQVGLVAEFNRVPLQDPFAGVYGVARLLGWVAWPWPLTSTATLYLPAPGPEVWLPAISALLGIGLAARVAPGRTLGLLAFTLLAALPMGLAVWVFATLGERYMYLPMVGVAAITAATVPGTRAAAGALVAWTLGALAAIHVRLPDWVSGLTLFEAAVARAPDSYSWNLYGGELLQAGQTEAAVQAMERSLAARPARRFACASVAGTAVAVMDAAAYRSRLPAWEAAGCRELEAFDFQVAWSLAMLGDEPSALEFVGGRATDQSGVRAALEADLAVREGDLVRAAGLLATSPEAGDARFRFGTLQALRTP